MIANFNGKVAVIGNGAVSQCTIPIFLSRKHVSVPEKNITVIDFEDKREQLKPFMERGINFVQEKVTRNNLGKVLSKYAGNRGLVIDLAWNIGADDIIDWCHRHDTLYVNTSVELWDPYEPKVIFDKTLYSRQMNLKKLTANWSNDSTTAVVDHGANPGLISHFTKQALIDIADRQINGCFGTSKEGIAHYRELQDFPRLAQALGVKVIHCSERDTQITNRPKQVDEFVNTWSIEGFREEGTAPAEMGWGTHEEMHPPLAHTAPDGCGPQNQIFLARMGINTWARSWVPEVGEIEGMIIRHGEAFGISDRLTVWENGKAVYRPTVHYVYMPCHEAISSLAELRSRHYDLQPKLRIMTDEIISGKDILGALVMGHAYNSWWTGSSLSIEQTREIIPGQNATTLQVAAGVISAVKWMIENPRRGLCIPDDLPHDYILNEAKPYLGDFISMPSDWTPLKNRSVFFPENKDSIINGDPWQFRSYAPLP
ncbi:MAG: saccharopine dehydrogenase C-terminal domain-containing protein [Nanoarchaeota archaeon]|nr:saccharopine dehydrogenase C-terminal domain-containing protein [Nanoarchaeota archaeon]